MTEFYPDPFGIFIETRIDDSGMNTIDNDIFAVGSQHSVQVLGEQNLSSLGISIEAFRRIKCSTVEMFDEQESDNLSLLTFPYFPFKLSKSMKEPPK